MKRSNPIRRVRMLLTPPCLECENCEKERYGNLPGCRSRRYLDSIERLTCVRFDHVCATNVRGTRYCRFERKRG